MQVSMRSLAKKRRMAGMPERVPKITMQTSSSRRSARNSILFYRDDAWRKYELTFSKIKKAKVYLMYLKRDHKVARCIYRRLNKVVRRAADSASNSKLFRRRRHEVKGGGKKMTPTRNFVIEGINGLTSGLAVPD